MNSRKVSRLSLGAVLLVLVLVPLTAACGGGGKSATPTPPPTATPDPVAAYKTQANALVTTLGKQADTALQDMQTAQTSQTDPKWGTVLPADADLITTSATQLKALKAPSQLAQVGSALSAAADQLAQGAQFLKQSVQTQDQNAGQQAFQALSQGRGMLTAAAQGLQ